MTQPSVSRLKELLFEQESRDIDVLSHKIDGLADRAGVDDAARVALTRRIDELAARAGSDELFRSAVARVLDASLKDAEKVRHQELTTALAPMVRRTFRAEIRSESVQSELSSALYPKIGDMIRRYVASAMRDMMDTINRKLEGGISQNRFVLKLRSLTSGRSMAELALADNQQFQVDELYLVKRGSGELVHHWSRTADGTVVDTQGGNRDTLISGFLTAITAFAEEAFAGDRSSLRALDLDQHRIYLRASPDYLLAAKCSGNAPAAVEEVLDAGLIDVLIAHQSVEARYPPDGGEDSRTSAHREHARLLQMSSLAIEEKIGAAAAEINRGRGNFRSLKIAAAVIGLPLLGLIGWQTYTTYITAQLQAATDNAIAAMTELAGYPVTARVERGAQSVKLEGLTPSLAARNRLIDTIQAVATGATLNTKIGILPNVDVASAIEQQSTQRAIVLTIKRLRALEVELGRLMETAAPGLVREAYQNIRTGVVTGAVALQRMGSNAYADVPQVTAIADDLQRTLEQGFIRIGTLLAGASSSFVFAANTEARQSDLGDRIDQVAIATERLSAALALFEQQQSTSTNVNREIEPVRARQSAIATDVETLSRRIDALAPVVTPQARLQSFVTRNAVFFSNGLEYRDADAAAVIIADLARHLLATDDHLRIAGYTDEAGNPTLNQTLSQQRADKIEQELLARGVQRARLVAVGRGANKELQPRSGTTNASRRVEFEIAFSREKVAQP